MITKYGNSLKKIEKYIQYITLRLLLMDKSDIIFRRKLTKGLNDLACRHVPRPCLCERARLTASVEAAL